MITEKIVELLLLQFIFTDYNADKEYRYYLENNYDVENQLDTKGEIFVGKGSVTCRTHYIHIQKIGSTYWNNFMYFKTYLLDHPETVKEYEHLKKELSVKYQDDRKKYTASKNEFISSVLEKAKIMYKL